MYPVVTMNHIQSHILSHYMNTCIRIWCEYLGCSSLPQYYYLYIITVSNKNVICKMKQVLI